jgi:glucokinase
MSIIAIDLGGTRIKIGIVADGQVLVSSILKTMVTEGLEFHLPYIKAEIDKLKVQSFDKNITGIGMAFPGLVNSKAGFVISASGKYEDASLLNLTAWAQTEWGLPFKMDNDARMACLGEWKYGAGKGSTDMVMCTLGTGVGSAVIMEGRLLTGKHFQAGILGGHSIINFNDMENRCSCGNYGCVEAVASTWRLKEIARRHELFKDSILNRAEILDIKALFDIAAKEDPLALILQQRCLNAWGVGLVNLIHAYDPEIVVVGGGIMHSKEVILPFFKKIISERTWCPSGIPEVRAAIFPDTSGLLGTALLFEKK